MNEPVYEMVSNDNPINNRLAIYIIDRILCGQTVIRSVMKLMRNLVQHCIIMYSELCTVKRNLKDQLCYHSHQHWMFVRYLVSIILVIVYVVAKQ